MENLEDLTLLSGRANLPLAEAISRQMRVGLGNVLIQEFSNENLFVKVNESVRENDVFVVQSLCSPVNTSIMELLIIIDAAKRASAGRITAVLPYYAYGRSDKKDQPRVPITARLLADLITVAGANRVLTIDLHAGQIQGFFSIPVDELTAMYLIADYFRGKRLKDHVVVSPDIGGAKRARNFAELLDAPLAIVEKRRTGNNERSEALNLIGEVEGKSAILIDEEINTGGSIVNAAAVLVENGAREIYACCTHPVLSGKASERLREAPIKEIVTTDTVPIPPQKMLDKIRVLSVAPMLAETIWRIHTGRSVGAVFEGSRARMMEGS